MMNFAQGVTEQYEEFWKRTIQRCCQGLADGEAGGISNLLYSSRFKPMAEPCHSHGNITIQSSHLLQQGERRVFFFSSMEKDNFLGWKAAWITILFAHNLRRRRRRSTAVSWCFLHKGLGDDADHSLSHRKCSSKLRINMLNPTLGR